MRIYHVVDLIIAIFYIIVSEFGVWTGISGDGRLPYT